MAEAAWRWRVSGGPYLGEISALCLAGAPPLLLLLAGTGSQLLLFDVASGHLRSSLPAFQGVRIHGVIASTSAANTASASATTSCITIAVFGETSVKLFRLSLSLFSLHLLHSLPCFDHWVLDARFLHCLHSHSHSHSHSDCDYSTPENENEKEKEKEKEKENEDGKEHENENEQEKGSPLLLAVGLSDNSVALWHLPSASLLTRIPSPFDPCLLYSMRLHGHSLPSLRIAAGTILNHILVWALAAPTAPAAGAGAGAGTPAPSLTPALPLRPLPLARLTAHHGSIFRLAWSLQASRLLLLSASDDRTARLWDLTLHQPQPLPLPQTLTQSLHTFFGHHARIWDCSFSPSLIITAGEDCTCRLWAPHATQLLLLKQHM